MIYAAPLHLTANDSPGCVDAALVRDAGPSRTRVVVCSHSRLLREGVALALAEAKLIDVRGTFDPTNSPSALERMGPDVLLLDAGADAPCELPGILRKVMPALRIVVFAVANEQLNVVAWAEAGVSGHVGREGGIAELIAAIDAAMRGEAFCSPSLASLLFARLAELSNDTKASPPASKLTPREREILLLVEQGLPNKEIARRLDIGHATVKNHVHHILEKMNARGRGEAAARIRRSPGQDPLEPGR